MKEVKKKREQIFDNIRKKDRDNIKKNLRDRLLQERQQQNYYPLISDVLQNFMMFQPHEISLHLDEISNAITQTILTEFSDDQHDDLITDLLYLVQEHQMRLPTKLKFKRNESNYTATLIALSYKDIDEAQLSYWVSYVSEQDRQLIFLSIDSQEQQNKWVSNPNLYQFLLCHIGTNKEAARSFKDIVQNCDQLSKKQIQLSLSQIQKSLLFESIKIDFEHQQLLIQILMLVTKILAAIKGKTTEVNRLINILKKLLKQRIDLFLSNGILSYFNDFYQLFIDVFFESDAQIETILQNFDKKIQQEEGQNQAILTMNYLLKLIYNHSRSAKMRNKMYKPSEVIGNWLSKAKRYPQLASNKILELLLNQN